MCFLVKIYIFGSIDPRVLTFGIQVLLGEGSSYYANEVGVAIHMQIRQGNMKNQEKCFKNLLL